MLLNELIQDTLLEEGDVLVVKDLDIFVESFIHQDAELWVLLDGLEGQQGCQYFKVRLIRVGPVARMVARIP